MFTILISLIRRYHTELRGAVVVEAAVILPFLAITGLGAVDASYMLLQNHKMEQALVSAAGFMSQSANPVSVESQAKTIAVNGSLAAGSDPLIKNWSPNDISISYRLVPNNNGQYRAGDFVRVVELETSLPYHGFGIIKSIRGSHVTLKASYQQRMTGAVE